MPVQSYALARGEPKRLKVDWWGGYKIEGWGVYRYVPGQARVFLDSNEIAQTGSDPLEYRLPDGSVIALFFDPNDPNGPDVLRDGERLPGSRFEPQHQLFVGVATLLGIAVAHFAVWWILRKETLPGGFHLIADWIPAAGLAYLVLGALVYYRSRAALWVSMAAWALEVSGLILVAMYYSGRAGGGKAARLCALYTPIGLLLIADDALNQLKPRKRASADRGLSLEPYPVDPRDGER
jgi:hypothetical protein